MTVHRKEEAWIKTKSGSHWLKEQLKQEAEEAEEETQEMIAEAEQEMEEGK